MTEKSKKDGPTIYKIKIKGRLDGSWSEWFEPMTITHTEDGDTIITGRLPDQAALQGVLIKPGIDLV